MSSEFGVSYFELKIFYSELEVLCFELGAFYSELEISYFELGAFYSELEVSYFELKPSSKKVKVPCLGVEKWRLEGISEVLRRNRLTTRLMQ